MLFRTMNALAKHGALEAAWRTLLPSERLSAFLDDVRVVTNGRPLILCSGPSRAHTGIASNRPTWAKPGSTTARPGFLPPASPSRCRVGHRSPAQQQDQGIVIPWERRLARPSCRLPYPNSGHQLSTERGHSTNGQRPCSTYPILVTSHYLYCG